MMIVPFACINERETEHNKLHCVSLFAPGLGIDWDQGKINGKTLIRCKPSTKIGLRVS